MTTSTAAPLDPRDAFGGLAFVLLWSTGYISAHYSLQGAGPFTLAVIRFGATALIIGAWLLLRRAPRPAPGAIGHAVVGGVLLQAGFFGFIYAAMRTGVEPAVAGLITGLMPLTTAVGAALFLGERTRPLAVLGLGLGLAGVLLVVGPELSGQGHGLGHVFAALALLSLSAGTLYQKRHASGVDARLGLVIHVGASLAVLLPVALVLEGLDFHPTMPALGGMAWMILVNSCAGLLLYLWLLRRGAAARVSSLFYLVPPVTAVLAAAVLGAHFTALDAGGFALAAAGVWLGQRG